MRIFLAIFFLLFAIATNADAAKILGDYEALPANNGATSINCFGGRVGGHSAKSCGITSTGGAITMTANPQVSVTGGSNGDEVTLIGLSNTDYVVLVDGLGLNMPSDCSLQDGITVRLTLINSVWYATGGNCFAGQAPSPDVCLKDEFGVLADCAVDPEDIQYLKGTSPPVDPAPVSGITYRENDSVTGEFVRLWCAGDDLSWKECDANSDAFNTATDEEGTSVSASSSTPFPRFNYPFDLVTGTPNTVQFKPSLLTEDTAPSVTLSWVALELSGGGIRKVHPSNLGLQREINHDACSANNFISQINADGTKVCSAGGGGSQFNSFRFFAQSSSAGQTWSNMPAAVTEIFGQNRIRTYIDFTGSTQVRVVLRATGVACFAGAKIGIQGWYNSQWNWLDGVSEPAVACDVAGGAGGATTKKSAWVNLEASAKADIELRVVGVSGDGVVDPEFNAVDINWK